MTRMYALISFVLINLVRAEELCATTHSPQSPPVPRSRLAREEAQLSTRGLAGDAEDAGDAEGLYDLDDAALMQMKATVEVSNVTAPDLESVSLLEKARKAAFSMTWVVPPNDPMDWLFGVRTTVCDDRVVLDSSTTASSVFIIGLLATCVLMVFRIEKISAEKSAAIDVKGGAEKAAGQPAEQENQSQGQPADPERSADDAAGSGSSVSKPGERLWHLDMARITAIMCVIFEHCGGGGYTRRNIGFGLWWALPFLYMTSGMACIMSRSSMWGYQSRLMCVFLVGTGANWIADVKSDYAYNPTHNFFNTMYQMIFVLMLMAMAIVTEPLRQALLFRKKNPRGQATMGIAVSTVLTGLVVVICLLRYLEHTPFQLDLGGAYGEFYHSFTQHIPLLLVQSVGVLFLAQLACLLDCSHSSGLVGWLLLAYIYLPSIAVPYIEDCFARWLSVYVVGMVNMVWPLKGQETIAKGVQAYWPFLAMLFCLLCMPNMVGRCDMYPPNYMWERFRHRAGECLFAICFLTASFKCSDPWMVVATMNYWSLFAYCFHLAFYRLLGSPYGATLTFAFIPVFFLIVRNTQRPSGERESKSSPS
mmetsp:Transcript_68936/g.119975  ORF Transcript_68936/g.119975 Transcript_68936/m.119975 type:complete len:590 (-) Transcript_68936:85-1854(-)